VNQQSQPAAESRPLVMELKFQYYMVSQTLGKVSIIKPYLYQINPDYQYELTYRGLFMVEEEGIHLRQPHAQAFLDSPIFEL
jgi:hypothetical protein